ncbi:MAG TPA: LysM domain-containing protein [Dehalococcoidia bacterium]
MPSNPMRPAAATPTRRFEAPVCAFVGLARDRATRYRVPHREHRCYAQRRGSAVPLEHQRAFCYSGTYAGCPHWPGPPDRAARPAAGGNGAAAGRTVGAAALAALAVVAAARGAWPPDEPGGARSPGEVAAADGAPGGALPFLPPPFRGAPPRVHVVAPGENLSRIAERYGTTVQDLAALNGLADPDSIVPGQRLAVPQAGR